LPQSPQSAKTGLLAGAGARFNHRNALARSRFEVLHILF
jgi:hypothetical protein